MRKVCLIQVPYMIGYEGHGASKGPKRFIEAGAARVLNEKGVDASVDLVERGKAFLDSVNGSLAVNRKLADAVHRAVEGDRFPLVLAGSCDATIGIMAGLRSERCGVVWFDAHGDFNTPETTLTGFFGGLPLAVLVGDCYKEYREKISNQPPVDEAAVLMLGVRDLDPLERTRLDESEVAVVEWKDGEAQWDVSAALDALAQKVDEVYVHIDLDALDPKVAPGFVDWMAPGGMSLEQVVDAVKAVASRFRIRAASVATYNPEYDRDDRALRAGMRLIELLASEI